MDFGPSFVVKPGGGFGGKVELARRAAMSGVRRDRSLDGVRRRITMWLMEFEIGS